MGGWTTRAISNGLLLEVLPGKASCSSKCTCPESTVAKTLPGVLNCYSSTDILCLEQ